MQLTSQENPWNPKHIWDPKKLWNPWASFEKPLKPLKKRRTENMQTWNSYSRLCHARIRLSFWPRFSRKLWGGLRRFAEMRTYARNQYMGFVEICGAVRKTPKIEVSDNSENMQTSWVSWPGGINQGAQKAAPWCLYGASSGQRQRIFTAFCFTFLSLVWHFY